MSEGFSSRLLVRPFLDLLRQGVTPEKSRSASPLASRWAFSQCWDRPPQFVPWPFSRGN